jgi:hypothetical protein
MCLLVDIIQIGSADCIFTFIIETMKLTTKNILFLLLLSSPLGSRAQDVNMHIGKAIIPLRIEEFVAVLRIVDDSIIRDSVHKFSNCALGHFSNVIDIKPNEVKHFHREIFHDKDFVWTRLTHDIIPWPYYKTTFLSDSPFYYNCAIDFRRDTVRQPNRATLEEETCIIGNDSGSVKVNYYLDSITKQDLINAIKNSFGLPAQMNVRLSHIDIYLIDSTRSDKIIVDYQNISSINIFTQKINNLPKGSLLWIHKIYPADTNGRDFFNEGGYVEALIRLKD